MDEPRSWSVWTRNTVLPALVVSFWSRVWIGRRSVLPVLASVLWMFLNPSLFPEPESTDSWASKAVLGERVWKNRDETPVLTVHKESPPHIYSTASRLWVRSCSSVSLQAPHLVQTNRSCAGFRRKSLVPGQDGLALRGHENRQSVSGSAEPFETSTLRYKVPFAAE